MTAAALIAAAAISVATAPAEASAPSRLGVSASEFRLTMSRLTVHPGPVIVQLRNAGEDPHDLQIIRLDRKGQPKGKKWTWPELRPGETSTQTVSMTAGRYRLICTLPGHRKAGMNGTLTVRRSS